MFSEKAGSVSQSIKIGLVFIAVMICACSLAQGQDTEQQLQLLKQQYEATTKEFEHRISSLEHVSLTGDCGFDHTHLPGSYEGWLRKCTFAPQIGADRKFFGRPVLRVFVTYANWSNGFRGLVGGVPFENQTTGLTYGVQAEHWW